jgi:uncharacterized protein YndB with AHSA1/START domain
MNAIEETVRIDAPASRVYEAVTQAEGYRGWWARNCAIGPAVGRESMLHFDKGGTPVTMRFRIDELVPERRVVWTCVAHDFPSWVGTRLSFELAARGSGETELVLRHDGWREEPLQAVRDGWRHFAGSLRRWAETGTGDPW